VKSAFAKATENKNGFLGAAKAPALEMTPTDVFFSAISQGCSCTVKIPGCCFCQGPA